MKLSTARRLVCMSYFTVDGLRPLLATATRIVCSGDTKRFLFPDGSVIESNKGNWKVVDMKKNPKLEAAVKRFGKGQVASSNPLIASTPIYIDHAVQQFSKEEICEHFKVPPQSERTKRLQMEVLALQELCNEKDEQLDKASRPMVVRLDWLAVALVVTVLVAHYGFGVL